MCAMRALMNKGAQGQLGKERKARGDEKSAQMDSRFEISAKV